MIIYSDEQIDAALPSGTRLSMAALYMISILRHFSTRPNRCDQPLRNILAEYDLYREKGKLSCFFDEHGGYVGHVVATFVDDEAKKLISSNPQYVRAIRLWRSGPPNWIVYWEAERHASPDIKRVWQASFGEARIDVSYIRPRRSSLVLKSWTNILNPPTSSRAGGAKELADAGKLADHFAAEAKAADLDLCIARLLAADETKLWTVREAVAALTNAQALKQLELVRDGDGAPGAVLWAWLSPRIVQSLAKRDQVTLRPSEWNSGRVPCVMASVGSMQARREAERRFRRRLPMGADQACRVVFDPAGRIKGLDDL